MNKLIWRSLGALALVGAAASSAIAQVKEAATVPISAFFTAPKMASPVLSPDGRRLAILAGNEKTGHRDLVVVELMPTMKAMLAARFVDASVRDVQWVNDERLVYTLTDYQEAWSYRPCPGLWAVNYDGSASRRLVKNDCQIHLITNPSLGQARELLPNHRLLSVLRDGSADVVVVRDNYDSQWKEVNDTTALRLNTLTGLTSAAAEPGYPPGAWRWTVDPKGVPRLIFARAAEGKTDIHWRASDKAPWQKIASFDTYRGGPQEFAPITIGPDGELYAKAVRADEARTEALFRFDREAKALEKEPLVGVSGFDFNGQPVFDHRQKKLLGVNFIGDAESTVWFDEEIKKLQARIDKRVPGHVNLLHIPECGCSPWVLVHAYSDRQPGVFLLFNRETDDLQRVGATLPDIDPRRMAERDFVRFSARDALSIPMHVTRPAGKGPWPTVVLLHGGPWVRGGSWRWTAESQFLASRGYLVLEPEFRGSDGYGDRHLKAGWKRWGLAMQDDVADATRWAIDQKLADPKRVCLAGASYGGYATLMGLIRDADMYRCGIAWVAVTDINLMYDINWSDLPTEWKRFGMPALIGDQVKDAAQLEQTSPLKQAHRLKQPLLLAFGGADRRVPLDHGTKFRDAVSKTNAQVEWVVYNSEGHGFFKPENRYDFYERMEKFLATHLQTK